MLILTREATTGPKSQIIIDKEIVVTVLEVRGGKVKLGIVAPPHIDIHRPEAKRKAA